jgi:hypothetical protein
MISVTLGRAVGKAHILGEGLATIFQSDKPDFFTVQADKSGRRYWMHRDTIKWRTVAPKEMEITE